ncbi:Acetylcholinesterase [Melipona quadrifasciata]|uniref:Acetylcholinesterase n=1 Tax=Melipona quadrifasciata TaxID=166423 RepID=A0A0N1IT96_9HYME|nr:Acetylcholinesterase [Melipona quadrifasciata]
MAADKGPWNTMERADKHLHMYDRPPATGPRFPQGLAFAMTAKQMTLSRRRLSGTGERSGPFLRIPHPANQGQRMVGVETDGTWYDVLPVILMVSSYRASKSAERTKTKEETKGETTVSQRCPAMGDSSAIFPPENGNWIDDNAHLGLSWNVSPENLGHMAALSPKQETNNALDRGLMHGANFPEHVRNPGQRDRPRRPRVSGPSCPTLGPRFSVAEGRGTEEIQIVEYIDHMLQIVAKAFTYSILYTNKKNERENLESPIDKILLKTLEHCIENRVLRKEEIEGPEMAQLSSRKWDKSTVTLSFERPPVPGIGNRGKQCRSISSKVTKNWGEKVPFSEFLRSEEGQAWYSTTKSPIPNGICTINKTVLYDTKEEKKTISIVLQYTDWEDAYNGYIYQKMVADVVGDYFFICNLSVKRWWKQRRMSLLMRAHRNLNNGFASRLKQPQPPSNLGKKLKVTPRQREKEERDWWEESRKFCFETSSKRINGSETLRRKEEWLGRKEGRKVGREGNAHRFE